MLGQGNVLITGNDGKVIEIVSVDEAGDDIQHFNGILSPGFINAHCHLELSHMKGFIPEKTGLVDFVLKVVFDRHFSEAAILAAIKKADEEMFANGIVAVGDICNNSLTLPQKQKSNLRYHNFIETAGFPPSAAGARFRQSVELYNEYKKHFPGTSLVPHAPYSVSPELFAMIDAFPENKILTIHNQETAAENEFFEKATDDFTRLYEKLNVDISFFKPSGKTSLQTYLPLLKKQPSLILVHNVLTNKEDIDFEKNHTSAISHQPSVFYCLCPNANQYITGSLPDINLLLDENCNIILGTDSLASNHQLSILEEMKTLQKHFPLLATETLLQWATLNGANALQMDDELGSFEKGKTPGIVLMENTTGNTISDAVAKRIL